MTAVLQMWTIYDRPIDEPTAWVVREWSIVRGCAEPVPGERHLAISLSDARTLIPAGRVRLPRAPGDDPAIHETWL